MGAGARGGRLRPFPAPAHQQRTKGCLHSWRELGWRTSATRGTFPATPNHAGAAMRDPVGAIVPGTAVTVFSGNQFQARG